MTAEASGLSFALQQGSGSHSMARTSLCQDTLPSPSSEKSDDLIVASEPVVCEAAGLRVAQCYLRVDPANHVVQARTGPPLYTLLSTFRI